MGRACSAHRGDEKWVQNFGWKAWGKRQHSEHLTDNRIILKWILDTSLLWPVVIYPPNCALDPQEDFRTSYSKLLYLFLVSSIHAARSICLTLLDSITLTVWTITVVFSVVMPIWRNVSSPSSGLKWSQRWYGLSQMLTGTYKTSMGNGGPFPGGEVRPGCDTDHAPPSSAEVMNEELYLLSPLHLYRFVLGMLYLSYL
jgi:hypothetical protein